MNGVPDYSWGPCVVRSDKLYPSCRACKRDLDKRFPTAMMVLIQEDAYRFSVSKYNERRAPYVLPDCGCRAVAGSLFPCYTHSR